MKNPIKILGLFLIGIGLFSFTMVRQEPITIGSIRDNFLQTLFSDYDPVDTVISITVKDRYSKQMVRLHPTSSCGLDPGYAAYSLYSGIDTGYQYFNVAVLARYKSIFGSDLIKGQLKLAEKDYEGKPVQINQYNPIALKSAFDKLYQKPTGSYRDIGLQKLYDLCTKQYVRAATDMVVGITAKKVIWDAQVKKYLQLATTKEEFYMDEFAQETVTKIFGEKEMKECSPYAVRMIGSMLRRSGDGSLPTILICLKTVLKDYDPQYYNQVALKF